MATTRSFNAMLNEYLPNRLLKTELLKRDWLLKNVQKDESWKGDTAIVPFRGQRASSVEFGALAASSDISEDAYVRGELDYVEVYGSMIFNFRDLVDHEGKVPENTFLKILPDTVDDFISYMKDCTSISLADGYLDAADGDGQAGGTMVVKRIDRFNIGQKVSIVDGNTASADYYVTAIATDTRTITVSATRGGSAADISAYTVAQAAKLYHPGQDTLSFVSLRGALLSLANGGDTNIHGVAKTAWPHIQAVNVDGSAITAANLLDEIFDAYTEIQHKARGGRCSTILMSMRNLGVIMKLIQVEKGGFHVAPGATKVSEYGWTEIMIGSPAGVFLKLAGVLELADDVIYFLDMKSLTFRSKTMFRRIKSPSGDDFFVVRNTSGYQYIVDHCLFGNLEVSKPAHNGVLHSISLTY